MKKVVFVVFGVFVLAPVFAEDAVIINSEIVENNERKNTSFDNLYLGIGVGGSFLKNETTMGERVKLNTDRFIGSAVFGVGKTFQDCYYVGCEGLVDFSKTKTQTTLIPHVSFKTRGVTPSFGFRLGYQYLPWNAMVYGKVSAVFPKVTVVCNNMTSMSISKATPSFELGVEKACGQFAARFGVEYVVRAKKTITVENMGYDVKSGKGFNVRAMIIYTR